MKRTENFPLGEKKSQKIQRGAQIIAEKRERIAAQSVGKSIKEAVFAGEQIPVVGEKVHILDVGILGGQNTGAEGGIVFEPEDQPAQGKYDPGADQPRKEAAQGLMGKHLRH